MTAVRKFCTERMHCSMLLSQSTTCASKFAWIVDGIVYCWGEGPQEKPTAMKPMLVPWHNDLNEDTIAEFEHPCPFNPVLVPLLHMDCRPPESTIPDGFRALLTATPKLVRRSGF